MIEYFVGVTFCTFMQKESKMHTNQYQICAQKTVWWLMVFNQKNFAWFFSPHLFKSKRVRNLILSTAVLKYNKIEYELSMNIKCYNSRVRNMVVFLLNIWHYYGSFIFINRENFLILSFNTIFKKRQRTEVEQELMRKEKRLFYNSWKLIRAKKFFAVHENC